MKKLSTELHITIQVLDILGAQSTTLVSTVTYISMQLFLEGNSEL